MHRQLNLCKLCGVSLHMSAILLLVQVELCMCVHWPATCVARFPYTPPNGSAKSQRLETIALGCISLYVEEHHLSPFLNLRSFRKTFCVFLKKH